MSLTYSHGREFVDEIRPLLERQDADALVRHLHKRWANERLRGILSSGHEDAAKIALACLSLTGTLADNPAIARWLDSDDAVTCAVAEHAMWSTWFRSGNPAADVELTRAVQLISEDRVHEAIAALNTVIERYPHFAEAHNQRAIAYFLQEDYEAAMADCRDTLRLNPHHFGAMAGLGHCYASLGRLDRAIEAYRCALELHPKLEGIRQTIQQIRSSLPSGPAPHMPLPEEPARAKPAG